MNVCLSNLNANCTVSFLFVLLGCSVSLNGMSISGPITASTVAVTGSVTMSSMTVSSLTVTSLLQTNEATTIGIPEKYIQMKFSSTTVTTSISTATFTSIGDMSISIALSNPSNYIRISLTGVLSFSGDVMNSSILTIKRGSTDLGNPDGSGLARTLTGILGSNPTIWRPVGIVITDSPGDTNIHTYGVYIRLYSGSTDLGAFPHSAGYLIAEEVSR